jgi:hypothetical protein
MTRGIIIGDADRIVSPDIHARQLARNVLAV